jgi:hypothetical protein
LSFRSLTIVELKGGRDFGRFGRSFTPLLAFLHFLGGSQCHF